MLRGRIRSSGVSLRAVDVLGDATAPPGQHDRADGRDQQQERGRLEHEQKPGQQQLADVGGGAERPRPGRIRGAIAADGLQARAEQRDQQLDEQRAAEDRRAQAQLRAGRAAPAQQLAAGGSSRPPM